MSMLKFENTSNARKLLIASLLAGSIVGCGGQGDDGKIFGLKVEMVVKLAVKILFAVHVIPPSAAT